MEKYEIPNVKRKPKTLSDIDQPSGNSKELKDETSGITREGLRNQELQLTIEQKKKFGNRAFWVGIGSLIAWCVIFLSYSLIKLCSGIELFSDSVLIAISTASPVNTFTAFVFVIRGLFRA